ncbi:uncharacterized protein A1O9_07099 [Exophiala aquamarina CBS 119918]|uniref:SAM-dependent MTase RsmB/NOP-type domain-containing protein n=1 Tax=Exophiala aquamarina CBS 119918 TaxID=1182545 RepID=A0A072P9X4_9EURO|nr:uncharacterized protein A1O9_07099 [Exophiala aquamarina CBS 119918]KEF56909.1 hypothetical protein A1O9_07099 [Exophiala aquamarina CBS 119918]
MSIYYDASTVLGAASRAGSLKSRIYDNKLGLRSKPAHLYALISETAKYDFFLKEVIDEADFLAQEPKLTPTLGLLLVHDYFFAKGGIAASSNHPLRLAIERHKARLQAEFTKARLRKRCASVERLKALLLSEKPLSDRLQPRWIRINTLKSSLGHELATTFQDYKVDATIDQIATAPATAKILAIDQHIPDLLAVPPEANFTKTRAYTDGAIILQDKASCFPAYLLAGDQNETGVVGDYVDGCAAPGNKTTHLAALSCGPSKREVNIYACEKDERRSKTLISMTQKAGAQNVTVLERQDFLALDPKDSRFAKVTHLLLDPSCSGSGILGREDIPTLSLPIDPKSRKLNGEIDSKRSKKRKRDQGTSPQSNDDAAETSAEETKDTTYDPARLQRLATLQSKIVQHAFAFPAALKVTYSTCSVHVEENEAVVARVLESPIAISRGWSVLGRQEQVPGLRDWVHRGVGTATDGGSLLLSNEILEACIRCDPGDEQGTMGFFLCGFVRTPSEPHHDRLKTPGLAQGDDRWEGFSD